MSGGGGSVASSAPLVSDLKEILVKGDCEPSLYTAEVQKVKTKAPL